MEITISQAKIGLRRPLLAKQAQEAPVHPLDRLQTRRRLWRLRWQRKSFRRRLFKFGIVGFNLTILLGVSLFVILAPRASRADGLQSVANVSAGANANPLDQVSAASVAVNIAQAAHLAEATAVKNQADTDNAELAIVPAGDSVVSKPQVVTAALKSKRDITSYTTQNGDTVSSLAVKFGVTSDSIKWSNGLTSDAVNAGTKLVIPPVNGLIYTVKDGDTAQSLAQKYNANADQIIAFNDAEVGGLKVGEQIEIPNGQQPVVVQAKAASSYSLFSGSATYGSNGYDLGYCTYWVAARRAQVGEAVPTNLGNASSWGYLARAYGLSVGSSPQPHAAAVTSTIGAGHVVFIESVNDDGSVNISEMNHAGWDVVDNRTISAAEAAGFTYIY